MNHQIAPPDGKCITIIDARYGHAVRLSCTLRSIKLEAKKDSPRSHKEHKDILVKTLALLFHSPSCPLCLCGESSIKHIEDPGDKKTAGPFNPAAFLKKRKEQVLFGFQSSHR